MLSGITSSLLKRLDRPNDQIPPVKLFDINTVVLEAEIAVVIWLLVEMTGPTGFVPTRFRIQVKR